MASKAILQPNAHGDFTVLVKITQQMKSRQEQIHCFIEIFQAIGSQRRKLLYVVISGAYCVEKICIAFYNYVMIFLFSLWNKIIRILCFTKFLDTLGYLTEIYAKLNYLNTLVQ